MMRKMSLMDYMPEFTEERLERCGDFSFLCGLYIQVALAQCWDG